MTKPKLYRQGVMWFCKGRNLTLGCSTPKAAYEAWMQAWAGDLYIALQKQYASYFGRNNAS